MANELGAKHWLGFRPQAAASVEEGTVNRFLATTEFSMNKNPKRIERKASLSSGRRRVNVAGSSMPEGKATFEVMASQPQPWYWALGQATTSQPDATNAASVYLHTVTDADLPVRLTAEGYKVFQSAKQGDAYIDKIKLVGQAGEQAMCEMEWFALTHTEPATLTSTTAFAGDILTMSNCAITLGGASSLIIPSVEIEWDGMLEQVLAFNNSVNPARIRRKEYPKVTGKLKFIDFPTAELAKYLAATSFALVVTLEGETISGAYKQMLRVTLPVCQYTGGLDSPIGTEVITGEADFEAYYSTADSHQIKVEAQNASSSIAI